MSVRYALLGLLAQRPRHGYELHAAFEAFMGGAATWNVKPAQVYATLARLQDSGDVEEHPDGPDPERRVFAVTEDGRARLAEWLSTPTPAEHQRQEVFVKLMLALATGEVSPLAVIRAQRARLYQELHELTALRSAADPQRKLAYILLLDSARMHLEADLRWLDMVEARLDEILRQPLPEPGVRKRGRPRKSADADHSDGRPDQDLRVG
jgi:DNA-binding PadR family transcriptional regulator